MGCPMYGWDGMGGAILQWTWGISKNVSTHVTHSKCGKKHVSTRIPCSKCDKSTGEIREWKKLWSSQINESQPSPGLPGYKVLLVEINERDQWPVVFQIFHVRGICQNKTSWLSFRSELFYRCNRYLWKVRLGVLFVASYTHNFLVCQAAFPSGDALN